MDSSQSPTDGERPSFSRAATIIVIAIALVGVAWVFVALTRFIMLVFAAVVLAVIFDALTRRICRWTRLPRGIALALAVTAILVLICAAFTLFGAQIIGQFDTIMESLPSAIASVEGVLDSVGLGDAARNLFAQGGNDLSTLLSRAGGYLLAATSGIADAVLVFVGAIFLASDPDVYRRGVLMLMPHRAEETAERAMDDATRGLRGWMIGQVVSSLVVGVFTWAGLQLLGVPAAGGLGVIAGLLDVIPLVGPIIAGVPAVLLAFTVSPTTALWTVLLFLVIQQLQGNFLQPMIQKQAVDVPPAVLLFAVVAAGLLFGALGVLLAAPLTVVIFVMVQRIYVRTILDRPIRIAGES
ncbi:putative PurR-regulated permease PerM [Sphingomonas jejuensis]|uniref:PurR-regulated permease PerM n=1 Tax=Sphingomonas jejuensis TaxID=904715 RepID=A0ABX0XIM3_9SPHN|nr:AI-2E family transporter [Sphingomonas jejuensis]NJC32707.1 putative PurR-regulated permease PerM [Sphingomonas jejuensis]